MKRHLALVILVFVSVFVLDANVHAQEGMETQGTGPYVGGHLGLNIADSEINGGASTTDYDAGVGLGGVLGYDFGNFRVDGDIALRFNTLNSLGGAPLKSDSDTTAFSFMVNGYFDFPTDGPVKPYVGGGIGFAVVSIDWQTSGFFPFSHVPVADDSDSGLAYQFSGGIGYEINPRTTVSFSYRYFATEEMQMAFSNRSPINSGLPFSMDYQSHEFNIGVRILFN